MKRNILANYAGAAVTVIAPTLALPLYLSALGPGQFGLVGFITMLQGLLAIIDTGLSQVLVREFAVQFNSSEAGRQRVASLLLGFERIYWLIGMAVAAILVALTGPISKYWLVLNSSQMIAGEQAVYGAAAIFLFQFPGLVYRSLLTGVQAQVLLNKIVIVSTIIRYGGGVILVTHFPGLLTYLIWNVFVSLAESIVRSNSAWGVVNSRRRESHWNGEQMRLLVKKILGMSGAVLIGSITVQVDKLIVSKMVQIDQLGYYMLAATVSTGVLQIIYPITNALLPKAVQLRTDSVGLHRLLARLAAFTVLMVGCGVLCYYAFGEWILSKWLGSTDSVQHVFPILSILLLGSAVNAFYNIGYIYWMVHERFDRVFRVNLLSLVLSLALIPFFVLQLGVVGAAFGWLTINFVGFVFGLEWMKKRNND